MLKRLVAVAAMAAACLPAAAEGEKKTLRREVLENGAVLIVKENRNVPVVTLQAWFPVGSVTEGENLGQGLSHFVEHMIFKGTDTQKPGDFARAVKAAGGDLNAYTIYDRTVFHCIVLSSRFDDILSSFSDVIMHSKMAPGEAVKEQQVIVNELKSYLDNPDRLALYAFNETAWRVHPSRHPVGGYLDQFLKLKPGDVGDYFRKWYAPNNMIFVCVGDVDGAAAMAAIRRKFEGWERKPLPPLVLPAEPPQSGERRETRTYAVKGDASSGARLRLGWAGVSGTDEDSPALDMAALVLAQGESSRLTRVLKTEKHLALRVWARNDTPAWPGNFGIGVTTQDASTLDAAEAASLAEVKRLQEEAVTADELARIRAAVVAYNVILQQDVLIQADVLGQGEMYHGNPEFDLGYVAKLKAVTPGDIQRVARKYLVPSTLTVVRVVPGKAATEEPPAVGAGATEFKPHIDEFTLDNGLRIAVRRNDGTGSFGMSIAFLAGSRLEPAEKPGVANLVSDMLLRGTKTRSALQVAEAINGTGGSLKIVGGRSTLLVNAEMLSQDFGTALDLAADILLEPAFDAAELEKAKQNATYQLRKMMNDATQATTLRFLKDLYPGHPFERVPFGTLEAIAAAKPEDLRAFHARFIHPENCVIAVAGDLDPAAVKAAIEKRFGSWPRGAEPLPVVPVPAAIGKSVDDDVTDASKKIGTVLVGFQTVGLDHEDRWALQVLEKILGGMGGRMWDAVREKKNLAYGVWATNATLPQRGYFQIGVSAQAVNVDAVVVELKAQLKRIREEPPTAAELDAARNGVIGDMMIDLQKNSSQSQQIALDTLHGLGPGFVFEAPARVGKLTPEGIRDVARKYLDPDKAVIVITRPGN